MRAYRTKLYCGHDLPTLLILGLLFLALANTNSVAQAVWQRTNGPEGGSVYAIAININGHIFAGTNGGGVFRSFDDGNIWEPANNGLTNLGVRALAVSASDDIFVGTGRGAFYSSDNGDSWSARNNGLTGMEIEDFAIHSNMRIYVATSDDGVFRSSDNGNTWEPINNGITTPNINSLAISSQGQVFAGTRQGIFRSTDEGDLWTSISFALSNTNIEEIAANSNGDLFAGTRRGEVFRLTKDDSTWQLVNRNLTSSPIEVLAINSDNNIFAGTTSDGVFFSRNNGNTWSQRNMGLTSAEVNAITFKSINLTFTGTTDGGVFRSSDNGASWTQMNNGITNTTVEGFAIKGIGNIFAATEQHGVFRSSVGNNSWTPFNTSLTNLGVSALAITANGDLYAGTRGGGVFRSEFAELPWESVNTGLTTSFITALTVSPKGNIFVGTQFSGVFRLSNDGKIWTPKSTGLANMNVFALETNANGHIFVGTNVGGIFRSTNDGDLWLEVNNGLTSQLTIKDFVLNKSGHIFVATLGGGVFRSTDNGDSWTPVNHELPTPFTWALAVNGSGHIFVGTVGNGVYRSVDNGECWHATNSGLVNSPVRSFAVAADGSIYLGTSRNGAFRSTGSTDLPSYPATIDLVNTVNFRSLENPRDYTPSDYRMVGLPGESDKLAEEFFSGIQGVDWQIYRDSGADSNFLEEYKSGPNFKFKGGRAFWLIHKGPWTISEDVPSSPLDSCQFVNIPLHPGWNLITNPFKMDISWSEIQFINELSEPIYSYDNTGFDTSSVLRPFEGYYFFNDAALNFKSRLAIPFPPLVAPSLLIQSQNFSGWGVRVYLSCGEFRDKFNALGVSAHANRGLDRFDFRKPRAVGAIPQVVFRRPEWDKEYSIFATDIRPEFEEKESWDFEVQSTQREDLKLTFGGIERVPQKFEIYLIDEVHARALNLRTDSLYMFTPAADISNFTVLVGKAEALQEQLQGIMPRELSLAQNYPNPFNPQTAIRVTIPVTTEAQLKIYDLLGREVRILHSGPLTPGRHYYFWNGKDQSGNVRASGVYFYRLRTSAGTVLTHKMILIR